jgi:hypothetical protein
MFNIHETVDSKGYLQCQDRELRGILRSVCAEVLEQVPSHQDKAPTEEIRQPQDQLCITGLEAMAKTGIQGLLFQSHKTFTLSQDVRTRDVPEAMVKISYHEQLQEQITFTKEANGSSQDSGYSTAPEAMVKFGQMSPPSKALAISLFTQDARTQDVPGAMVKFSSHEHSKNR